MARQEEEAAAAVEREDERQEDKACSEDEACNEPQYEVRTITAKRVRGKESAGGAKVQYRVEWHPVNRKHQPATWEDAERLEGCEYALQLFKDKEAAKSKGVAKQAPAAKPPAPLLAPDNNRTQQLYDQLMESACNADGVMPKQWQKVWEEASLQVANENSTTSRRRRS